MSVDSGLRAGLTADALDRLERVADALRRAVGAEAASVSWSNRKAATLDVLVNVGVLRDDEEQRPQAERHPLEAFPLLRRMVVGREGFSLAPGDPSCAAVAAPAPDAGRDVQAGVPIVVDGEVWGAFRVARVTPAGEPARAFDLHVLTELAEALAAIVEASPQAPRRQALPGRYELRVAGRLAPARRAQFEPLEASFEDGCTVFRGWVRDRPELYGYLRRALALGAEIVALNRLP